MLVCCMMIINIIRSNKVTFSWRISIRITTILGRNYRLPFGIRSTSRYRVRDGSEDVNCIQNVYLHFWHERRLLRQAFFMLSLK